VKQKIVPYIWPKGAERPVLNQNHVGNQGALEKGSDRAKAHIDSNKATKGKIFIKKCRGRSDDIYIRSSIEDAKVIFYSRYMCI
jgi:hypothetical protein